MLRLILAGLLLSFPAYAKSTMSGGGVSTTGYVEAISATGAWLATQAEAEAGTNNDQVMTPLRTKQAIDAQMTASTPDRIVSGTASFTLASTGTITHSSTGSSVLYMSGAGSNSIELGQGRTTNNYAYIDLIGDATYTDYGLRLIRHNAGPNAGSWLQHRGTGDLTLSTTDSADIAFQTASNEKMRIEAGGNVGIGTSSPQAKLDVRGAIIAQSPITVSNSSWAELDLRTTRATANEKLWNLANDSGTGNLRIRALTDDRSAEAIASPFTITRGGLVGLSMVPTTYRLEVNGGVRSSGEIVSTNANNLRIVYGNYGTFWRQDGANLYQMITASADQYGSYNSLRPLTINLASGAVTIGTALTNSANQIEIQGTSPRTMYTDTDSNSRFWTYIDGANFYVLADRDNNGAWESPHPLQLNSSTNTGLLFGQTIWHAGNDGAGSGLDADLLDGLASTAFLRTTVNQWNTSTDGMERIYFSNGARTYMKGGGASDYMLTLRNNSNSDVVHFSSDGNMWSNVLGNWLTAFLNQGVRTDSTPTFSNVYIGSLSAWFTNLVNQSLTTTSSPYFGSANSRATINADGAIRLWRGSGAPSPDTNGYIDFTKDDSTYGRLFFQDNIKRFNMMGSTVAGAALYVQGPVSANGAYTNTSDGRLKKDVHDLSYGLADVMKLRPVTFQWKTQAAPWQQGRKVGLIAQEVEKVVPEVVTSEADVSKTRSIAYGDLVPVLIKSVQELKQGMDDLKKENADLKRRLQTLEAK